ncbi:MAG: methyltransferase domain-containing protein [Lachnospiraceae bacterium]|nr:methyltransferase domain-containing protein [Lachnospiraceae bacterium]
MNTERINELRKEWEAEEKIAHIHGWDFSHIHGRYNEEEDLPWDYKQIIEDNLTKDMKLFDFDTGGGEFLRSLKHPYENTAATEGYPPNAELCKQELLPLGIDFKVCDDASNVPFADDSFDMIINRHGDFDPKETARLLRKGGLFITEQVGSENDRDLVKMVLPEVSEPFPDLKLSVQRKKFEDAGFEIIRGEEVFRPIQFYDVGAFVWFAHIIEWEFPDFSVDKCFDNLLKLQEKIDKDGVIEGTIHRYLIVAKKR